MVCSLRLVHGHQGQVGSCIAPQPLRSLHVNSDRTEEKTAELDPADSDEGLSSHNHQGNEESGNKME